MLYCVKQVVEFPKIDAAAKEISMSEESHNVINSDITSI
jgi:hypothetical protein